MLNSINKSNNKGFTLVELLAVLGLLTIIALLGVPVLMSQIESQKKKNYENFLGDLCLSAEAYINHTKNIEGIDEFKEPGDMISIKMEDLIVNNYIKSNTKNPKTKETIKATDKIVVVINENKTYDCSLNDEFVSVALDSNGGTLEQSSKKVIVGKNYGTLPTPTKNGYIFKGWNGKNIFDYELYFSNKVVSNNNGATNDRVVYTLKPNTQYTISSNIPYKNNSGAVMFIKSGSTYSSPSTSTDGFGMANGQYITRTVTTDSNGNLYIMIRNDSTDYPIITTLLNSLKSGEYWIQLEEGDTSTDYEPYYIQSTTKVKQKTSHTLKAIWDTVPSEYQKVEYIEATGTQYVSVEQQISPTTGFEAKYQFTDLTTQQRVYEFSTSDTNYLNYQFYINGSTKWAYAFKDGEGNWTNTGIASDTIIHVLQFNVESGKWKIDNTIGDIVDSTRTKTSPRVYLFGKNRSTKAKIYEFKIYDNGQLVRNYIPVYRKSDNVIGLYEQYGKTFYTNSGTGTFTKGNNV